MEDQLRRALGEAAGDFHMSPQAPARILLRARIRMILGGAIVGALLIGLGAGIAFVAAAIPDPGRDHQPPASDPSYPYTIARAEIGKSADVLRINRDEDGAFLELIIEPDGDTGGITRFPMEEPIDALWHVAPDSNEAAVFGAVTARAVEVVIELDDGESYTAELLDIPEDFKIAAYVFVGKPPPPRSAGQIVAYDGEGEVVGRFAFPGPDSRPRETPGSGIVPQSDFTKVATGEAVGEPWRLLAGVSNKGVALKFEVQGGGFLEVPSIPDPCRAIGPAEWSLKAGDVRKGVVEFGAVSLDVDAVRIRLSDGRELEAQVFPLPQEFNAQYKAFVASFRDPDPDPSLTKGPRDPRVVDVVLEDNQGRKLEAGKGCLDY